MSKNKYYLATGLIGLLITTAVVASVTFADTGGDKAGNFQEKRQVMLEKRQEMKEIFENNDYDAWQDLMNEKADSLEEKVSQIRESITQENFDKLSEIHQLLEDGKYDEARELKEEMGLGGFGPGMHRNYRK